MCYQVSNILEKGNSMGIIAEAILGGSVLIAGSVIVHAALVGRAILVSAEARIAAAKNKE